MFDRNKRVFASVLCFASLALQTPALLGENWPGRIELPPFPKRDPGRSFADLKVYDAGSPLRVPKEDWGGARERAQREPEWRDWIAARRVAVDEWIPQRNDKTSWVAGWSHNFVDPDDGTELVFTPDEPGPLFNVRSFPVKVTPKIHAAWVARFRARHGDRILDAARLYRVTGEVRYAEWVSAQLDFYANSYDAWPGQNGSHFTFQTLDDAVLLTKWVTAARTLGESVTAERKDQWVARLFKPQAHLLSKTFQVIHNIACWHRAATGHVALYADDDELWAAAVEGPHGIRNQIARGITSDYLWFEQSLGYNEYVVRALAPFFEHALLRNRGASLRTEMETLENLALAPLFLRFPDGRLPTPSEGRRLPLVVSTEWLEGSGRLKDVADNRTHFLVDIVRLYPTTIGLKLAERLQPKSWEQLLDPVTATVSRATLPPVTSRDMHTSRMAILRGGPWQVYFHYGQIAGSHAQAEALNFEASYDDIDVTHDSGTPLYGAALNLKFFRNPVAHNVPVVDGRGQNPGWQDGCWDPGKRDSFSATRVSASQPRYRTNARAARTLRIDGDRLHDQVRVATTDGKRHALGFLLNLQGRVVLPARFEPAADFAKDWKDTGFEFWEDVRAVKMRDRAVFDVEYGVKTFRVELKLPGEFTVFHGSVPDYVPGRREALYIEQNGKQATLNTVIASVLPAKGRGRNR